MTDQATVTRCQRGTRCEEPELDDNDYVVGATSDRPLCRACEQATTAALDVASSLYDELRAKALDRTTTGHGTKVTRSAPGSFGLNGAPLHLADDLHWTLTTWADQVICTAGRPAPDRTSQPEPAQVADAAALLTRYLSAWISHEPVDFQVTRGNADPEDPRALPSGDTVTITQAGWEACAWLLDWRARAEKILTKPLLIHYPPEPCPACDQPRVLRRRDGDDKVTCTACRKEWTLAMYETFVHAWIGSQ